MIVSVVWLGAGEGEGAGAAVCGVREAGMQGQCEAIFAEPVRRPHHPPLDKRGRFP